MKPLETISILDSGHHLAPETWLRRVLGHDGHLKGIPEDKVIGRQGKQEQEKGRDGTY